MALVPPNCGRFGAHGEPWNRKSFPSSSVPKFYNAVQLHRDIKLTNIFIGSQFITLGGLGDAELHFLDSNKNCKVGDFGLATSSLAAVDPSELSSPMPGSNFSDMTLDVGTRLYIAPEILSKRGGSKDKDHSKADLYSLGVSILALILLHSLTPD